MLQIRVRELLRGEDAAQQARQACAELAAERDRSRALAADAQRALAECEQRRRRSDAGDVPASRHREPELLS